MRYKYILFFLILVTACRQKRDVDTSFYYWKTVYKQDSAETNYLRNLKVKNLYVRIMDVDAKRWGSVIPVAPIGFSENLPDSVSIVPVVFITNDVFLSTENLEWLPHKILQFVKGKVNQSGKDNYKELQIDCDWTESTKEKYFSFLTELKKQASGTVISTTLRLHQLKNQSKMGIPPADKVLLMCYNMGNLRKYGTENSILETDELKKYVGENLSKYKLQVDVALPLFSWSVVFRKYNYLGISHQLNESLLKDEKLFSLEENGLYKSKQDIPKLKILKHDEVRYEKSSLTAIEEVAKHLSSNLSEKSVNLIFYHLDKSILKNYTINDLEKITNILH